MEARKLGFAAMIAFTSFAVFLWGMYFTMFGVNVAHKISSAIAMIAGLVVFGFVMAVIYTNPGGNGEIPK